MTVESKLPTIITEEKKNELTADIVRNGGKVTDPNFKSLEDYLERNPLEKGARKNIKVIGV